MSRDRTVLLLGASGTAGGSAMSELLSRGYQVRAHTRSPERASALRGQGVEVRVGEGEGVDELAALMEGCSAVIDVRVRIPSARRAAMPGAWREYVRLRDEAAGRVVDAAIKAGVRRVVHDTVTMVYADGGDAWLDESSPVDAPGVLAANLATEAHLSRLTAEGGEGVALRFGQFYSDADPFSIELMDTAAKGRSLVLGDPDGWTSAIHVLDAGRALVAALDVPPRAYNVTDDEPLRRRDLVELLARCAGRSHLRGIPAAMLHVAPAPVRALARSQRVSSDRFKALGWQPTVPSRREGWPAAFAARHGPRDPDQGAAR